MFPPVPHPNHHSLLPGNEGREKDGARGQPGMAKWRIHFSILAWVFFSVGCVSFFAYSFFFPHSRASYAVCWLSIDDFFPGPAAAAAAMAQRQQKELQFQLYIGEQTRWNWRRQQRQVCWADGWWALK